MVSITIESVVDRVEKPQNKTKWWGVGVVGKLFSGSQVNEELTKKLGRLPPGTGKAQPYITANKLIRREV